MKWSKDGLASLLRFARKNGGPWEDIADDECMPDEGDVGLILAAQEMFDALYDAERVLERDEPEPKLVLKRVKSAIAKAVEE